MSDLSEVASKIADWNYIRSTRRLEYYVPYEYQLKFHNAVGLGTGRPARQRLLMAGNKVGKTLCSAFEVAIHATGKYPSWWGGSRFRYAPEILVCGLTNDSVRDLGQRELLGDPTDDKQLGTGTVPKSCIGKRRNKTGVPNAYHSIRIQHATRPRPNISFPASAPGWRAL